MLVYTIFTGNTAIGSAASWIEGVILGQVATSVAVVAIAVTGLMMLGGRLDWRRGVRVVVGCFVLFGAPTIAAGLMGLANFSTVETVAPVPQSPSAPVVAIPPPPPAGYDPYAGASVPVR